MQMNESLTNMELLSNEFKQGINCVGMSCKLIGKEPPKPRLLMINRDQMRLHPVEVEKLVSEDHEVRAIWELVGKLDLTQYYESIEAKEGIAGRSAYDPRLLISIWIYSYSKGTGSAREITRLCEYDPAYQWLTGMDVINYHTLSDFRANHREALDKVFIEVLGVLSSEGLITLERVMHDGTKVKAYASGDTFRKEERITKHLEMAKEQVKHITETTDEEMSDRVRKARERAVREKQEKLELAVVELEKIRTCKSNEKDKAAARVSMTDPEARIMKQPDGGFAPSYNVQITTDAEKKIIVGMSVCQSGSDYEELEQAEKKIEENMGQAPDKMIVDGGFISRKNIIAMNDKTNLIGPIGDRTAQALERLDSRGVDAAFRPEVFSYDSNNNYYTCPAGKILKYLEKEKRIGLTNYKYQANESDCQTCCFNQKCCPKNLSKGRLIIRKEEEPVVAAFTAKMETEEYKAIYKQRGEVAEFPNAWIKSKIGLRQFRLQGLIKVGTEALWACLTYNVQQWIRLCWKPKIALV